MYNKKLLLTALKNLNQTKAPVKKKDIEESPLGKLKKGGVKKFSSNLGAKNVLYTKNALYKKPKKNPLYKKPNYKNKIYDPYGMAFDNGGIIENNPGGPPEEFYKYWYKNRVMPTPEGQKLLEKIRPEALERASQNVPYIYSEELKSNEAGYYDPETQQIILNKDLPEAQIEATKHHEFGHHIQAGDKFSDVLEKPHQYLVEQNIIEPKEIKTGNPEWDKNLKKNFDEITNANELQQRVMTLRNECGFKPDQVVTVKDIEDCFKRKKEAGEALDPDIEDLRGVTKGTKAIVNLSNDMVSVPGQTEDIPYLQFGGAIEIEIDEADIDKYVKGGYVVEDISVPSLTRMDEGGEKRKKRREPQEPMNNTVWSGVTPEIITPGQDPFSLPTVSPTPVAEIKLPDYTPEQIDDYRIRKEAQDRKLEKINAYAPKELTYKDLSRPKGSFVPGEDMTDELLTELKNSGYYPKKTPEGDYEIFSSKDVADLIYTKGLNPNELSTELDLGDATELKTYFDPIYQNASMIHAKRNKEKIDNLIKTGLTKTQAIDQLVEEGEGTKSGLTKLYGDYTEKTYKARQAEAKKLLAAGATNPNNLTNYQKQNLLNIDAWVQEERDKQTGKDYIVLEDGSKILSPYAIHPNSILPSESTAIRNKVGAWTTDPATGKKQWVAPNNNTAAEEAQSQEFLHQQAIDNFNRTTALQAQAAKAILLEKNLTNEQRKKFLEDPKEFQKIYESYVNWVYAPEGSTTGYIQASGLPGQNQLKSDFNITAEGPKWSAGTNRKNAASGAVDMLDKEWIMGVAGGLSAKPIMGAVSSVLSYAPIASAPWLTAGNALNAYFGYEAIRPGGNISKSVDAFSEGNIREGAVEAGWGALGLLPFVKPTVQGAQILKQLKTPGSIQVLPKSGNYSFLYKSPAEGGLLVGNPNLNGSEQVLTGVTEAFNKFSRAAGTSFGGLGLGEFKIMKQTPTSYGYASTVAEGMTLGDMATVGQTVKTTTPALAPSLLELKTSDFNIDKLVGNFRIPTQGSASVTPLDNQTVLQKYTGDPNMQGIASPDNLGISAPLRDLNAEKELLLTDQLELQKKFEDGVIEFDEYVKTNDELTNKLNTVDEKLNTQKTKNIEALSDNEIATNVINDMRANKIELWQTEEGQKRLQEMIDNTPSLQGQTPDTLIEGMASMNNINNHYSTQLAQRNELLNEMSMYDKMYENGQISKSDYFNIQVDLDEKLGIIDNNISELSQDINQSAFYGGGKNEIAITPGLFSKGELPKVTAHELGHFLGSYAGRKSGTTYLDETLKELDLVKPESKQLEIPGLDVAEESKAHDLFGNARPNYVSETLKYFDKGSKGTERVPFLAEVRQDMLDKGLIKHEYDPITPDLLKKHYDQYKGMKGEKYPLRIYDIIKDKPKNFDIMSKVLNKLPMIIGGGLAVNELTNDDKDSNVSEAGLGLFLAFISRNPNAIKTSKRLQGLVNNFNKYGNVALKELKMLDKRYLTKQIQNLEKEKTDIWDELGIGYNSPKGLTQKQTELIGKTETRKQKFKSFLKMRDVAAEGKLPREIIQELNDQYQLKTTPEQFLNAQETRLDFMDKVGQIFNITPEGLEKTSRGLFEGVTTTGVKPVTDLSTGQVVNAEVRLPGAREEYKLVNGEIVNTSVIEQQPIISGDYITALKNSRADVEAKISGAKVFGSSVLVTEAGMPHITGDIDVIITQSDYNKNVKDNFKFVQDYGPAKQHTVYPQYGEEGILDFNIIHEDANGMVKPFYNPATPDKTPTEIELFRQFYPEKFQEAATKAMVSGKPIEINMTSKDFMAGINPEVKTVIDSYETSPFSKWGNYNPNKEKHILRPDVLIAYGNPEVVAKGQEAYIKSIVGPKGNLGHQFKPEELSDVNKNVDALLKMDFNGDILQTAQDPKRMQLALNDYYINNTVFSREISAASLPGQKYTEDIVKTALTEWFPGKGGSVNGIGLNTVQKGNPTHIPSNENPVIGHRQLGLNLNTSDPVAYVESVIKGTSGNYVFTPEELKIVEELAEKYLPDVKSSIGQDFTSRKILDWYPRNLNSDAPKNFLNELSEKTGIRAIRKEEVTTGGYGRANAAYASVLGKFDEAMDAMMYSLKEYHASPKTLNERKNALKEVKNKRTSGSSYSLKTKEDFQRLYSILDGGRNTLESRINQTKAQIEAANNYRDELIARLKNSDDVELEQLNAEITKLQDRLYNLNFKDLPEFIGRMARLDKMYNILITGGAAAAAIGLGYLGLEKLGEKGRLQDRERERQKRKLKLSREKSFKDYYKAEKNVVLKNNFLQKLPDIAQEWLLSDMWRDTWPTGEPYVITKDGYIEPPKKIKKISNDRYEWILSFDDAIGNDNEKKFGGEASMDLELTPEEIKDYVSRGYLVYEK
jgi:hypothetical protein